jgi:hypothetical protein
MSTGNVTLAQTQAVREADCQYERYFEVNVINDGLNRRVEAKEDRNAAYAICASLCHQV